MGDPARLRRGPTTLISERVSLGPTSRPLLPVITRVHPTNAHESSISKVAIAANFATVLLELSDLAPARPAAVLRGHVGEWASGLDVKDEDTHRDSGRDRGRPRGGEHHHRQPLTWPRKQRSSSGTPAGAQSHTVRVFSFGSFFRATIGTALPERDGRCWRDLYALARHALAVIDVGDA